MALSAEEKKRFLKSLDEDKEFRYAVAGYLGIGEILKRLDSLEESMVKLWEEVKSLREDFNTSKSDMSTLKSDVGMLKSDVSILKEDVSTLKSDVSTLKSDVSVLKSDVSTLKSDISTLKSDVSMLKSDMSTLKKDVSTLKKDVGDIRTTLDRLTLTVEDEARSVIKHRIKRDLNIDIELDRVFIDEREVNIYGAVNDICVIGEATVRLGTKLIDELLGKIELIKHERPDLLRKKIIKVIYTDYAVPDAVESARNRKVWILRRKKDLTPMVIEEVG
jgi:chromosome segregation ATPase